VIHLEYYHYLDSCDQPTCVHGIPSRTLPVDVSLCMGRLQDEIHVQCTCRHLHMVKCETVPHKSRYVSGWICKYCYWFVFFLSNLNPSISNQSFYWYWVLCKVNISTTNQQPLLLLLAVLIELKVNDIGIGIGNTGPKTKYSSNFNNHKYKWSWGMTFCFFQVSSPWRREYSSVSRYCLCNFVKLAPADSVGQQRINNSKNTQHTSQPTSATT
jgi:hypothetical protein